MIQNKIVLGAMLILLIVGFCGCTELQGISTGQISGHDKFELISYSIDSYTWMDEKISSGFNHDGDVDYYKIQGKVINKVGHDANIDILLKFYDEENNLLGKVKTDINNIPDQETRSFSININKHFSKFGDYFDSIEKVTFEFIENKLP